MTNRDTTSYTHGSVGSFPATAKDYAQGDILPEDELDKYVHYMVRKSKDFANEFDRLDSDDDGVVDGADKLETNGSPATIRDTTNNIDVLRGNEGGAVNVPNGRLFEQGNRIATQSWVNNNVDVSNVDYADNAGNADTVDGQEASDFFSATKVKSGEASDSSWDGNGVDWAVNKNGDIKLNTYGVNGISDKKTIYSGSEDANYFVAIGPSSKGDEYRTYAVYEV